MHFSTHFQCIFDLFLMPGFCKQGQRSTTNASHGNGYKTSCIINNWLIESTCYHKPGHLGTLFAGIFFPLSHSGNTRSGVSLKTIPYGCSMFDSSETYAEISLISFKIWSLMTRTIGDQSSISFQVLKSSNTR